MLKPLSRASSQERVFRRPQPTRPRSPSTSSKSGGKPINQILTYSRKDFWDTRTSGARHVWNCIRSACEENPDTAEALILAADLQMPQNSLTLCIDETGVYYRVPICVINDPISYDADFQAQKLKSKAVPDEVTLSLKMRNPQKGDIETEVSNLISIKEFKQLYLDKVQDTELSAEMVRMFAMGKELKDDLFVYSYDIMNESTVQVMIRKPLPPE